MTDSRAAKLKRLVRVQQQIERMAENDLATILREQALVDEARQRTTEAIGSLDPVHTVMSGHYARRFQGLAIKTQHLNGLRAVQERRVLVEHTKTERLEKRAHQAGEAEEREAEDASLLDLIDLLQGARAGDGTPV